MPDSEGIFARRSQYLERYVQIGVASGRVISVTFPDTPDADSREAHELLDRIEAYLEGVEDDFSDVEVAWTVGDAERSVLERLRAVPYGEDVTVEQLVTMTPTVSSDEDGMELVRRVLAENPTPVIVPDHRVRDGPSALDPPIEQKLRHLEGL